MHVTVGCRNKCTRERRGLRECAHAVVVVACVQF